MVQHAVRIDVASVLSRTFSTWFGNIVPFSALALIVMSPVVLYLMFGPLETKGQLWIYATIATAGPIILGFVTSAAVAYGVYQRMRGATVTVADSIKGGLRSLGPVIGVGLTVAILVGIGFLLLVVPGIILACVFYVAVPAAVLEGAGVAQALRRSAFLTKGARVGVFLVALILGAVTWAASMVVDYAVPDPAPVYDPAGFRDFARDFARAFEALRLQSVIGSILGAILGALTAVGTVYVYHDLRAQKEHVDVEAIARVFD